jgi:hypothetical protein
MPEGFESGALLGHVQSLADGSCVRLRLARSSDVRAIAELLARHGLDACDLRAARLVHFDPRHRYVVCVTGLVGSTERLLGVGAIELSIPPATAPEFVITDAQHRHELCRLLTDVLVRCAQSIARSCAA